MKRIGTYLLTIYRLTLSPIITGLGGGCRFHPSCSAYAQEALDTHSMWRAFGLIVGRLVRCGPWHPGGMDPVPIYEIPNFKHQAPIER